MESYDVLVIGFGKGGKTLAAKFGAQGKRVAMIEKDDHMFGGTCINIGCIPTKILIHAIESGQTFEEAMSEKQTIVQRLRAKNFAMLDSKETVDVFHAHARFVSNHVVSISSPNGESKELTAPIILINTGAKSVRLPIKGLTESKYVYDSTAIQSLSKQPDRLGIIGAGAIGLEFTSLFSQMGTKVTLFDSSPRILSREEEMVSDTVQQYLTDQGVQFELGTTISQIENEGETVVVCTEQQRFAFDSLLYATGRKPNSEDLGLENTTIRVEDNGAILVDDHLQTSVPGIFALGDVTGGLQFTYVSLDDSRIVWNYLNGNTTYSTQNRRTIPYTLFLNPPLSRVGIDEGQAQKLGLHYKTNTLSVAAMPRGHVNNDLRGFFKVVVDADTDLILGATLLSNQSPELINLITLAMDNNIPYTYFQKQIFTHPTMAENFNDLFNF